MTTALTDLERQALQGIFDSDFRDGDHPVDKAVWTWSANPFASKKTFSGVVSSLVKKGYVWSTDEGEDSVIAMTQAGYDAWKGVTTSTPQATTP